PVREATLVSPTGARVAIMSWGVTLRDWQVPVGDTLRPVVLGFPDFAPYPRHGAHFGAICGRVANRIAHARFSLGGETHALDANWRGHTLHGGARGLSQVNWALEHATDHEACFTYMSPDGDGGFPGTVRFSA